MGETKISLSHVHIQMLMADSACVERLEHSP